MRQWNKVYAGGVRARNQIVAFRTGVGSVTANMIRYVGPDAAEYGPGSGITNTGTVPEPPVERNRQEVVKNNDV